MPKWPSPRDYNEAMQNLRTCLADSELSHGEVELDALGLPRPITGNFASVYKIQSNGRNWAVRCFLRHIEDQALRYEHIHKFVYKDKIRSTLDFEFINRGIKIGSEWFPILKMEWADGITCDEYVRQISSYPDKVDHLIYGMHQMCTELQEAGIAHGDLQHGNILICENEIKLVDYDGMWVPSMKGWKSNEIGHPNYQHPRRTAEHFGPDLDNFSFVVIHTALEILKLHPRLFSQLNPGQECLLFRRIDFHRPLQSLVFSTLEHHGSSELRELSKRVRILLTREPDDVPFQTETEDGNKDDLPPMPTPDDIRKANEFFSTDELVASDAGHFFWVQQKLRNEAAKSAGLLFKNRALHKRYLRDCIWGAPGFAALITLGIIIFCKPLLYGFTPALLLFCVIGYLDASNRYSLFEKASHAVLHQQPQEMLLGFKLFPTPYSASFGKYTLKYEDRWYIRTIKNDTRGTRGGKWWRITNPAYLKQLANSGLDLIANRPIYLDRQTGRPLAIVEDHEIHWLV